MKQPQFAPLNLAEQVAIVYAGVKGLIDEVPEEQVTQFARELRDYLKTNKPDFIKKVQTEKKFLESKILSSFSDDENSLSIMSKDYSKAYQNYSIKLFLKGAQMVVNSKT